MTRLLGSPWPVPVGVWVASRAVVLLGLWRGSGAGSPAALLHVAADRYDARWYAGIVRHGYGVDPHMAAFYPGYPVVVRGLWAVIGNLDIALLLTVNLAVVVAAVALHTLYVPRIGLPATTLGTGLLLAAPAGIFLDLAFSEAVFLAAVAATFLLAVRGRWLVAGAAGAAACLVHFNGALLGVPLLLMAVSARAWRRPLPLAGGALVFVAGAAAYPLYLAAAFHDPLRYVHLQSTFWHHRLVNPLRTAAVGLYRMVPASRALITLRAGAVRPPDGAAVFADGAMLTIALGVLAGGIRRLTAAEWAWVLLVLLPPLASFSVPDSLARYLLAAFPIYYLAGRLLAPFPPAALGLMAIGLAFQGELAFRVAQGYFIG